MFFKPWIFFIILSFILTLAHAESSNTQCRTVDVKILPNKLGHFKNIECLSPVRFQVYMVKLTHYSARVFKQTQTNQLFAEYIDQLSKENNFDIAINGGFYSLNYQPIGLFIDRGHQIIPWVNSKVLSACLRINRHGKISIGRNKIECLKDSWSVLQAGPLLINHYSDLSNFSSAKTSTRLKEFFSEKYRTVVALNAENELLLIIASKIKLRDLVFILKHHPEVLGEHSIQTALNLDGGSSTGMFIRFTPMPFYFHEQKPVKTLVFFN